MWLICPVRLHWRELIFLLQRMSIEDSFLGGDGSLSPLRPCLAWTWASFVHAATISIRLYVIQSCYSLCVECSISFESCTPSGSQSHPSSSIQLPEPWGKRLELESHSDGLFQNHLITSYDQNLGLNISFHQLQEEISLIMAIHDREECHWNHLLFCTFSRTKLFISLPKSMSYRVSGHGHLNSVLHGFHPMKRASVWIRSVPPTMLGSLLP